MTALLLAVVHVAHAAERVEPIDPALCRALVKHTPDASVAYQPGVDVSGNPVAPADLPGSNSMQLPTSFKIPLTASLGKVLNLHGYPYDELGPSTEIPLGELEVTGDQVTYNGQPLSDAQQDNLAALCLKKDR